MSALAQLAEDVESVMSSIHPHRADVANMLAHGIKLNNTHDGHDDAAMDRILTAIQRRWHKSGLERTKRAAREIIDKDKS